MTDTVAIYLELPDGRVVLQRRDDQAPTSPNLLAFFGGHIEAGEDPLSAAHRELDEETSLGPQTLSLMLAIEIPSARHKTASHTVHLYRSAIANDRFDVFEGRRAESYAPTELLTRRDLAYTARFLLQRVL